MAIFKIGEVKQKHPKGMKDDGERAIWRQAYAVQFIISRNALGPEAACEKAIENAYLAVNQLRATNAREADTGPAPWPTR